MESEDDTQQLKKHICNKCKKEFSRGTNLRTHLNRKNPCVPKEIPVITGNNEENRCQYCNNTYASKSNLRRHVQKCSMKNNQAAMIQVILHKLEKIEEENKELRQNQHMTINNNITNNVQNNLYMNVTFCSFGNEDFNKLDTGKVMNLLRGQVKDFMSKMIEYIHTDPDHPEYHNIFYDPSRKKAIVFTRISDNEMSWQTRDFREVSDVLTDRIRDHVAPGNGPYFDLAMKDRDYDTSNNIINIAKHINWKTDEAIALNQQSLSKLASDPNFTKQVNVQEIAE